MGSQCFGCPPKSTRTAVAGPSSSSAPSTTFQLPRNRGEGVEGPIVLARKFREMAGFTTEEIDDIAEMSAAQRAGVGASA